MKPWQALKEKNIKFQLEPGQQAEDDGRCHSDFDYNIKNYEYRLTHQIRARGEVRPKVSIKLCDDEHYKIAII